MSLRASSELFVSGSAPNRALDPSSPDVEGSAVRPRAYLHTLGRVVEARGTLTHGEIPLDVPFAVIRFFVVTQVPPHTTRGDHAHKRAHQMLICVHGSCEVDVDDGSSQQSFVLDTSGVGLYVPPLSWCTQRDHSADCVLLVFASEQYDPDEYIRDFADFRRQVEAAL